MKVHLVCITMAGSDYWLAEDGTFPEGELREGESPAAAARRLVKDATGTEGPKLELADLRTRGDTLALVFRALLVGEPRGGARRKRMELPERVGTLSGREAEETLKTSLAYKLTRGD